MDIDQIIALIQQGESQHLEFKKSTTQLKPGFETVCAFLNGEGGTVLIGVTNNGQVLGQDVSDNTRQEIAREISKIEPPVQPIISYVPTGTGKFVIAIEARAGRHAPYVYQSTACSS